MEVAGPEIMCHLLTSAFSNTEYLNLFRSESVCANKGSNAFASRCSGSSPEFSHWARMIRLIHSLVLACAIAATSTTAIARSRHYGAPPSATNFGNPSYGPNAGFYNPARDPDAVSVGGTYAGSDPDPNRYQFCRPNLGG
jgi:hypothetical protein